jgi:hypothetical protein
VVPTLRKEREGWGTLGYTVPRKGGPPANRSRNSNKRNRSRNNSKSLVAVPTTNKVHGRNPAGNLSPKCFGDPTPLGDLIMKNYDDFHDGTFDGVWVDDATAYVFLNTFNKEPFTAVAGGIAALTVTGFKKGNLVFEVVTRSHDEVTAKDIADLYDLTEGEDGIAQAAKLLMKAQQERLSILEITPSYGATCLLLSRSIEVMKRNEWSQLYLSAFTHPGPR